ncbi:MAG: four helix bundle protein [Gemmatimonadaceae bacterium]
MQNPTNLRVTEQARRIAVLVYEGTRQFPATERYGLTAQMRDAAVSIGSNICEGCGRFGDKELARFLQMAYGSASELQFQVGLASDLGFLSADVGGPMLDEVTRTKKMLSRLITAIRRKGA